MSSKKCIFSTLKNNLGFRTLIVCVLVIFGFSGCNNSSQDDDYFNVEFNIYDSVLKQLNSRSILPDVQADSFYFTLVATNNAGSWNGTSQNADGSPTDIAYKANSTTGIPVTNITFNLKAGNYWRITAYGTDTTGEKAVGESDTDAITRVSNDAKVTGSISFYLASNGSVYKINNNLNTATPTGDVYSSLIISTTASATGTGSLNLTIRTTAISGIGYIKVTCTGRELNGSTPATKTIEEEFTAGDITTTIDDSIPAGLYDVDITFAQTKTSTIDLYQWHDTLTVWNNTKSTWFNSGTNSNYTEDTSGIITGTANTLYLDVSDADITNFKRKIFYVAQTTTPNILPAGSDTTGKGSIFKPYATVGNAVKVIREQNDTTSEYHIVVDGDITETDTSSLGGIYVAPTVTNAPLTIVIRSFTNVASAITKTAGANALLYTEGTNTNLILRNIELTGTANINNPTICLDNSKITGIVTLEAASSISVDVDDTASYVGSIKPTSVIYDNFAIIKEWNQGTDDDDTNEKLTEEWLSTTHGASVINYQLESTFVGSVPLGILAVDTESGSSTEGSVILKRKSAIGISSISGYTCAISIPTTTYSVSTIASDLEGNISVTATISIKDGESNPATGSISNVKAIIYDQSGTSFNLTADDATSYSPTFLIPGYIRSEVATFYLEISGQFINSDSSVNELFANTIPITIE